MSGAIQLQGLMANAAVGILAGCTPIDEEVKIEIKGADLVTALANAGINECDYGTPINDNNKLTKLRYYIARTIVERFTFLDRADLTVRKSAETLTENQKDWAAKQIAELLKNEVKPGITILSLFAKNKGFIGWLYDKWHGEKRNYMAGCASNRIRRQAATVSFRVKIEDLNDIMTNAAKQPAGGGGGVIISTVRTDGAVKLPTAKAGTAFTFPDFRILLASPTGNPLSQCVLKFSAGQNAAVETPLTLAEDPAGPPIALGTEEGGTKVIAHPLKASAAGKQTTIAAKGENSVTVDCVVGSGNPQKILDLGILSVAEATLIASTPAPAQNSSPSSSPQEIITPTIPVATKKATPPRQENKTIQAGPNASGIASRMTAKAAEAGWGKWSCASQPDGSYNCLRTKQ
ncbi:MAG: hypothetical protein PHH14_00480 [Candidatus Margulisbacteria bacterium]|nr:hypothetical protein [Candidatus Margulisiibacteriota bacterium]